MKRKITGDDVKSGGYYVNDFVRGFWGEFDEGHRMLSQMKLPHNKIPFSVSAFLNTRKTHWKDSEGNLVLISFVSKPTQLECFGSYLGKKRSIRMFLEWSVYEDDEKIIRLESEAIGDLCMKCIYETLLN